MNKTTLEELIVRLENYLECWKQYAMFVSLARSKKFTTEDENQFLETKSLLTQELELILSRVDCGAVTREEIHALITAAPSIRFLSELNDNALKNLENQWHKLFIGWQSILGQLKVKCTECDGKSFMGSIFRKRAA